MKRSCTPDPASAVPRAIAALHGQLVGVPPRRLVVHAAIEDADR